MRENCFDISTTGSLVSDVSVICSTVMFVVEISQWLISWLAGYIVRHLACTVV